MSGHTAGGRFITAGAGLPSWASGPRLLMAMVAPLVAFGIAFAAGAATKAGSADPLTPVPAAAYSPAKVQIQGIVATPGVPALRLHSQRHRLSAATPSIPRFYVASQPSEPVRTAASNRAGRSGPGTTPSETRGGSGTAAGPRKTTQTGVTRGGDTPAGQRTGVFLGGG